MGSRFGGHRISWVISLRTASVSVGEAGRGISNCRSDVEPGRAAAWTFSSTPYTKLTESIHRERGIGGNTEGSTSSRFNPASTHTFKWRASGNAAPFGGGTHR